jgi:beta-lactamase regulating signal transducer with metallopeptidase domain
VGEWATILLRWGLGNAVSSAALAVLVAAIAFPLRRTRPAVVHALWLLVLLKLLTPALWNVNVRQAKEIKSENNVQVEDVRVVYLSEDELAELPNEAEEAPAPPPAPRRPPEPTDWWRVATTSAAITWTCGSGLCLLLIVTRSLRFRRLLRFAAPAPADVVRRVRSVARQMGMDGTPAVCFIPGAVCPMLYAFVGRARLLLPSGLWDRLTDEQRDTLIAHELAHYRRRDHWVRLVEAAATVFQWWNPVLWLARRGLREAEEQCCDAWVVWSMPASVRDYMSAILEAVEYVSEPKHGGGTPGSPRAAVPALASGLGEFRRLERRLHMIRQNPSPRRLGRLSLLGVLCAAGGVLPLAPTLAQVETTKPETPASADRREVVITRAEIAPGTENPGAENRGADAAPHVELRLDPLARTVTATDDVVVTRNEPDVTSRVVDARTGAVVEVRGKALKVVAGSDLDQARAEVERAQANLDMARQRLKQLEARASAGGDEAGWSADKKLDGKTAKDVKWKKDAKDAKAKSLSEDQSADRKEHLNVVSGDQEKRMERLEQRLEKLDAMLRSMQENGEHPQKNRSNAGRQ